MRSLSPVPVSRDQRQVNQCNDTDEQLEKHLITLKERISKLRLSKLIRLSVRCEKEQGKKALIQRAK